MEDRERLKRRQRLERLRRDTAELEAALGRIAAERDRLLLQECADPRRLPQTALAALSGVSARWIRKLEEKHAQELPPRPLGRPLGAPLPS